MATLTCRLGSTAKLYLLWLYLLWLHLLWLHLPAGWAALPRGGRTCIVQLICDRYDGVLCTV